MFINFVNLLDGDDSDLLYHDTIERKMINLLCEPQYVILRQTKVGNKEITVVKVATNTRIDPCAHFDDHSKAEAFYHYLCNQIVNGTESYVVINVLEHGAL